jgi:hypothetical protein
MRNLKFSTNYKSELVICNLKPFSWRGENREYNIRPQDGKLEAFFVANHQKKFVWKI